ncbi:MAG: sigma-54 dependent transcriptional regulator [Brevinematales bacterium]|nr:sigma-54 dependent transcriptional regulator [Brevinematales bacterium]
MRKILVVDDEINITKTIKDVLEDYGFSVITLNDELKVINILNTEDVDTIILDLLMPNKSGIDILKEIVKQFPMIPVIIISGHGTISATVECMKLGAFDFVEKPLSIEKLISTVKNAIRFRELELEKSSIWKNYKLIGNSDTIKNILETIEKIRDNSSTVLITGENGVGKEIVARLIHYKSPRKNEQFIAINCAAIPDTLLESELFGYEKGAFTGAVSSRKGKIEMADKGTLFLDEIGDLPLHLQPKLLRVLQERVIQRLGSNKDISVDIRLICSTNKDLKAMVTNGQFREDLFYRINVIPIYIPPLRERKEDILPIASYYLNEFSKTYKRKVLNFDESVIKILTNYNWPGNVRELRNIVERLVIVSNNDSITYDDVKKYTPELLNEKELFDFDLSLPYKEAKEMFEKIYFTKMLEKSNNNISKLSELTQLDRTYLYRKLEALGIRINQKND